MEILGFDKKLIYLFASLGNPMPSGNALTLPFTAASLSPTPLSSTNASSLPNPHHSLTSKQRKERSCKGKRYLEILSESKLVKRNRTNSQSSSGEGNTRSDEANHNNPNNKSGNSSVNSSSNSTAASAAATAATTSKWVSGGFDLEEHIAALPQLGDTHLLSALSHSKANKQGLPGGNGNGNGGNRAVNHHHHHHRDGASNHVNEDGEEISGDSDSSGESRDANGKRIAHNTPNFAGKANNNVIKDRRDHHHHRSGIHKSNHQLNHDFASANHVGEDAMVNCTQNSPLDLMKNSQGAGRGGGGEAMAAMECDGLAALAEVALQQAARNSIT